MLTGIGEFWVDGDNYGKIRPGRISLCSHAVLRFQERIRPDVSRMKCGQLLQSLSNKIIVYRLNKKDDGTWYLLMDYDPQFTIVAKPGLWPQASGFVTFTWKAITCLYGYEHY